MVLGISIPHSKNNTAAGYLKFKFSTSWIYGKSQYETRCSLRVESLYRFLSGACTVTLYPTGTQLDFQINWLAIQL